MDMARTTYVARRDAIFYAAWEVHGVDRDDDMWFEKKQTLNDAVNNSYYAGISNGEWLRKTMSRLDGTRKT
jgi:hypothetical protein